MSLREAILALMPATVRWFEGEVPEGVGLPRVSVTVNVPGVEDWAMVRRPQSRRVRADFVVAGGNDEAVHGYADQVLAAFEGVRPVAVGWVCGPFELLGPPSTYSDRDSTVTATDTHPRVTAFSLACTATETT